MQVFKIEEGEEVLVYSSPFSTFKDFIFGAFNLPEYKIMKGDVVFKAYGYVSPLK